MKPFSRQEKLRLAAVLMAAVLAFLWAGLVGVIIGGGEIPRWVGIVTVVWAVVAFMINIMEAGEAEVRQ